MAWMVAGIYTIKVPVLLGYLLHFSTSFSFLWYTLEFYNYKLIFWGGGTLSIWIKHVKTLLYHELNLCTICFLYSTNWIIGHGTPPTKIAFPLIEHVERELVKSSICSKGNSICSKGNSGVDGLSCKLIKLALPAIADSNTHIINLSLSTVIFPDMWKEAIRSFPFTRPGIYPTPIITGLFPSCLC